MHPHTVPPAVPKGSKKRPRQDNSMEIPFEFGECRLRSMKEEDGSTSKKTMAIADYDSDETVVGDSTPGSDDEEDELCLKRMFPKVDVPPTSGVSVCPKKIRVGEQSPEIHVIPKLDPAALIESVKTATRQESETLSEEEASQSLLRNWERKLKSGVPPLKEDCSCQPPMDDTGLCEDSQQLFDSLEEENCSVIESQEAQSLLPAIIDVSYPEKQTVLVDKVCMHNEDLNVSKTNKDGSFPDDMVIGELLQVSSESDSFADMIDDLSFLEMSEDGSGELNAMVLAAINSMQNPQAQAARDGPNTERYHGQVNFDFNSDHTQIPDSLCTDESGEYKKLENGLYMQKTDKMQTCRTAKSKEAQSLLPAMLAIDISYPEKETVLVENVEVCVQNEDLNNILEENFVAEERNIDPPFLFKNVSCIPSICSHLANGEEKSVIQKSPQDFKKELFLTKRDCKNVSWNDASCSQASMSPLEQIKPASEVSKTAVCNKGVRKSPIISNKVSHLKESITSQPQENVQEKKSTENTKDTEITVRKSARLQNKRGRFGKRNCSIDTAHRIEGSKKYNSTPPVLFESTPLNGTESVQYFTASKTIRKIHKRDFMGETLLHKACRKSDLEQVNCLIEAGINVNQKDNAGWAAIHEASCNGNTEVILALIQAGANINSKGLDGITPLHDAVYCNHFEVVEILLQLGANPCETDDNMKNAFDKCCSDKMAEILASHKNATENRTANKNEPHLNMTPNLATCTYSCRTGNTYSVKILDTLQDIESKQKKLLSTELDALEDAETCIEELNAIQNAINNTVNLQKIKRDALAKKYRASADCFKQGILRDKISKMASNQKTLLQVVRTQKEVTQKIVAHQQARRSDGNNGETSSIMHYCDTSPGRNQISALCAVKEWLESKTANASTMTMKIPAVPDTESNQSQPISRTAEHPTFLPISEAQHNANLPSKQIPMRLENGPLNCDSCSSIAPVESHDRMNDHLQFTLPKSKSLNSFPVGIALDTVEKRNISVKKISHQTLGETDHTADTDQQWQKSYYEKAVQQADDDFPVLHDISEYSMPQQKAIGKTNNVLNKNAHQNNIRKPASKKEQKHLETEKKKKTFTLQKLMKLGKIKPGVDVLNFQLQDYSCKATLLSDGQVTDCSGKVFRDPVQWVRVLLGNNISVTWKYVADKVTYIGKKLSSFKQEDIVSKTIGEHESEKKRAVLPSHHPLGPTVLQVNEILLVDKSEFFPSHTMDKLWEEFMNSNEDSEDL
ncbi:ankyrin repeat domain-containing protein 31 isoform X3 [Hyla sarda]|uniref:ankyrin repeat domain-containing protein 31 isoform X3 n=1 Tax=Hyla sarda TaxID=327740 RepID=UPI0024C2C41B|nr:ankyrin repeat domain-containing protein 31 isoform X3 [Hyla sarda]